MTSNKGNLLARLWKRTPVAFRTGFLAMLGAIAALWLVLNISVFSSLLRRPVVIHKSNPATNQVFLYDYEFEQDVNFDRPDNLPCCRIIFHAWVYNPLPREAHGWYHVEFRDVSGRLLKKLGPAEATFPNTKEPCEATWDYWMPDEIFRQVDLAKSRIYIQIKK